MRKFKFSRHVPSVLRYRGKEGLGAQELVTLVHWERSPAARYLKANFMLKSRSSYSEKRNGETRSYRIGSKRRRAWPRPSSSARRVKRSGTIAPEGDSHLCWQGSVPALRRVILGARSEVEETQRGVAHSARVARGHLDLARSS